MTKGSFLFCQWAATRGCFCYPRMDNSPWTHGRALLTNIPKFGRICMELGFYWEVLRHHSLLSTKTGAISSPAKMLIIVCHCLVQQESFEPLFPLLPGLWPGYSRGRDVSIPTPIPHFWGTKGLISHPAGFPLWRTFLKGLPGLICTPGKWRFWENKIIPNLFRDWTWGRAII